MTIKTRGKKSRQNKTILTKWIPHIWQRDSQANVELLTSPCPHWHKKYILAMAHLRSLFVLGLNINSYIYPGKQSWHPITDCLFFFNDTIFFRLKSSVWASSTPLLPPLQASSNAIFPETLFLDPFHWYDPSDVLYTFAFICTRACVCDVARVYTTAWPHCCRFSGGSTACRNRWYIQAYPSVLRALHWKVQRTRPPR